MTDCLFCKIINKEIPAEIVYEDEKTLAFLDINQRSEGHTLVVSKRHSETMTDLPDEEICFLFRSVKRVLDVLRESINPDGFTIGINHGKASGQEIGHLHVNIIPRFNNDGGMSVQSIVNNPPKKSLKEIAELIRRKN